MDEKDKVQNSEEQSTETTEKSTETSSKVEKSSKDGSEKTFSQKVKQTAIDYRGEFRKINWPSREDLQKKSVTVIGVSLIFAVMIFGIDSVYNGIIEFLVTLL